MIDIEHLCPGCMHQRKYLSQSCPNCGYPNHQIHATGALPPLTILSGRYLLGCPVGKGGFGITYIAMDLPKEEIVAVKEFFPAELAIRDEESDAVLPASEDKALYFRTGLKSFCEEGRLLQLCADIPAIVSFREMLRENETAYLVMDYVQGISLRKYMKQHREPFAEDQALELMRPIMEALSAMHRRGILHRDISPENLILGEDQRLTLIDFGAAREFSTDEEENLTIILKRGYAPEEQYHSGSRQGPWTDLYAACAVLYHMMTNILPQEAAARVESDQLTPLRRLPGFTFRESTCAALEKGLQVDPAERYADIPALIKELYPAKRTDLSQISEEAEKAEFREEAHEAESHETEPHKEHSAEAEESNELLKKTAEDELTNKQELKGKIEPSKKADATKNSNNESAASTQDETLLSEQQDISNKPKTLSENAEVETSAKTFSERSASQQHKEDVSAATHTRKKKSRLLIPALLLIFAIGIGLYLIPSVYTPEPSVSLSKAISNLDTALESGSSIDFPTAADQVFSHWCIAIQEEDREKIGTISEHITGWCQQMVDHFEELRIMKRLIFEKQLQDESASDDANKRMQACGKLLNIAASAYANAPYDSIPDETTLTNAITSLFRTAFSAVERSDPAGVQSCRDELTLLRYLYMDIFTCESDIPTDSYKASASPTILENGLRNWMEEQMSPVQETYPAILDVEISDFWTDTFDGFFQNWIYHYFSSWNTSWNDKSTGEGFGRNSFNKVGRVAMIYLTDTINELDTMYQLLKNLNQNGVYNQDETVNSLKNILATGKYLGQSKHWYYIYDGNNFFPEFPEGSKNNPQIDNIMIINDYGLYFGSVRNGKRYGNGIQFSYDNYSSRKYYSIYIGEWKNNSPNGYGVKYSYLQDDGRAYCIDGNWTDGLEDGTMYIALDWVSPESLTDDRAHYQAKNGIRTTTGQTDDGRYIFADDGQGQVWYLYDPNEKFGTAFQYYN